MRRVEYPRRGWVEDGGSNEGFVPVYNAREIGLQREHGEEEGEHKGEEYKTSR